MSVSGGPSNKVIVRRFYDEVMNRGELAAISELTSPDLMFAVAGLSEPWRGHANFTRFVTMLRAAVPDCQITVEHLLAEADAVVGHWTMTGTHSGSSWQTPLGDVAPASNRFAVDGMDWFRIEEGKIVEYLVNQDALGLLLQLGALPALAGPAPPTTTEQNKALARRYFTELISEGRIDLIDELFTPDFAFRIPTLPQPVRGWDGMRQFVLGLRTAFPDVRFTVERILAEADKVAARWAFTGTHRAAFLGVPASGNAISDQGIDIFRFAHGKIAEVWVNEDDLGLMQQLGAIPARLPTGN